MFAILFGLSMDYNVFLQSRIREEYHRGADAAESVVSRPRRASARIILAAGAIMTAVFLGFATDPDVVVKTIGVGLSSAILIDVLVVRLIVAPAVMTLLGDRAWWLPAGSTASCRDLARGRRARASRRRRRGAGRAGPDARRRARLRRTLDSGGMADFAAFDTRGYRTVDVRSGYGEWVDTYEQTVEDAMDIELLEALARCRGLVGRGRRPRLRHRPHRRVAARARRGARSTAST